MGAAGAERARIRKPVRKRMDCMETIVTGGGRVLQDGGAPLTAGHGVWGAVTARRWFREH